MGENQQLLEARSSKLFSLRFHRPIQYPRQIKLVKLDRTVAGSVVAHILIDLDERSHSIIGGFGHAGITAFALVAGLLISKPVVRGVLREYYSCQASQGNSQATL
jgi:hypothetical protein